MLAVIVVMVPLTVPKLFGYHIYGVLTGSMEPAYSVGSVVYVKPGEPESVKEGDVITFLMGTDTGYGMTHRVVEVNGEDCTFITKGDANDAVDSEPVSFDRMVGRVVLCIPGLARVSDYVNSTSGKAVLFMAFALSFILWITADLLAPKKRSSKAVRMDGEEASAKRAAEIRTHGNKGAVRTALRLAGLAMIVGAAIYLGSVFWEYQRGGNEYDALQKMVFTEQNAAGQPPDNGENLDGGDAVTKEDRKIMQAIRKLKKENKDVVGWIVFDNMELSYPIMQGADNAYYLTHTFSGETNSAGSIFMEAANSSDFSDCHTILYGHNMKNQTMFGQLKKYRTEDFYKGHEYFAIYTENEIYRYQIFAYYDISEFGDIYTIGFEPDEEFAAFIGDMKKRSYYDTGVEVTGQDRVITLSTCSEKGKRFVVNAKRTGTQIGEMK